MPRVIRMPGLTVIPKGSRRRFLDELYVYYKAAGRPTLTEISDAIADGEYRGTASRETVRRILTQGSVPTRWTTVESIFMALCAMAQLDPAADRWESSSSFDEIPSRLGAFRDAWNEAVDEEEPIVRQAVDDPWAVSAVVTAAEPPF